MGNPLSKGPVGRYDDAKKNNLFTQQFGGNNPSYYSEANVNNVIPVRYSHRLAVIRSLNCFPSNSLLPVYPNTCENNLNSPTLNTDIKVLENKLLKCPDPHILDFTQPQFKPPETPDKINLEINVNPKTYSKGTDKDKYTSYDYHSRHISTKEIEPDNRIYEIDLSPFKRDIDQPPNTSTRIFEKKENTELEHNVSTFFQNGPKMAMKGRSKETKAAKRKREAAELAATVIKRGKDEDPYIDPKDIDKYDCSDWEVPYDDFMKTYLGSGSSSDETEEKKEPTKKKDKETTNIEEDSDSDSFETPLNFRDEKEVPRTAQMYKPGSKKKAQWQRTDGIYEPQRGKGSFGRFETFMAKRKMGLSKSTDQRDTNKSHRPDFDIIDPGDGEDDWGTPRVVEPPPETVVVPWVPYGNKQVVSEDGTITYTKPDTVYEKFTQTNLGNVLRESMDEEEIDNYLKEEKEREERLLNNPPESSSDDDESTDSALYRSDGSDDYDVSAEDFDKAEEEDNRVYGIPTNFKPYTKELEEEGYLSDADENQTLEFRPTEKKDLKYLGDVVKAFRFENPSKDDEPMHCFEFKNTSSEQPPITSRPKTGENEEIVEQIDDDDYDDDIGNEIESPDEYDDGVANANKLIKERDIYLKEEKSEMGTHGLPRLQPKNNDGNYDSQENVDFALILEDGESNYEDDEIEEDYDDNLKKVKLVKNINVNPKLEKKIISYDSEEDVDPSDESETYDSEKDDYEDNVREEEYNDGIQQLNVEDSCPDTEDADKKPLDTEDEVDAQYEKYFGQKDPLEQLRSVDADPDYIDPNFFDTRKGSDYDENDANNGGGYDGGNDFTVGLDDEDSDDNIDIQDGYGSFSDGEGTDDDDDDDDDDDTYDESESDYDPNVPSDYGDFGSPITTDDEIVQNYNPTELLNELELQGDTFDDFPYSLENAKWVDFPYKHPGDAEEAAYDRGEPGKELPYWYFIKHPAEDDSLMNIRAKLADQYDHQTGPYNPFKINPPPTPLWLDDTFDLVPKGAKVPDDFFYGFMKPDPETMHKMNLEDDDDDDDGGGEGYVDDDDDGGVDGRSWRPMDPYKGPNRTWKSWRSRPEDDSRRPGSESMNTALKDLPEDPTQNQRIPKKNDQWQHYRDWLLRQGTKTAPKTTQESTNTKTNLSKPIESMSEGRFAGKRVTEKREESFQPRPHYQTWLTKQADIKRDESSDLTKRANNGKPLEVQKTTHKRYEEAYVDDKWSETKHKPSENMWQHYQTWKQKNKNNPPKPRFKPDDSFVFSKPPEDVGNDNRSRKDENSMKINKNEALNQNTSNPANYSGEITKGINGFVRSKSPIGNTVFNREANPINNWNPWRNPQSDLLDSSSPSIPHKLPFSGQGNPTSDIWDSHLDFGNKVKLSSFAIDQRNCKADDIFEVNFNKNNLPPIKNKNKITGFYKSLTPKMITTQVRTKTKTKQIQHFDQTNPADSLFHVLNINDPINLNIMNQQENNGQSSTNVSRSLEKFAIILQVPENEKVSMMSMASLNGSENTNDFSNAEMCKSNVNENGSDVLKIDEKAVPSDTNKPKRKYTRRNQRVINCIPETATTNDSNNSQVKKKRKYTRRSKPVLNPGEFEQATGSNTHETLIETDGNTFQSSQENIYSSIRNEPLDNIVTGAISDTFESAVIKSNTDINAVSNHDSITDEALDKHREETSKGCGDLDVMNINHQKFNSSDENNDINPLPNNNTLEASAFSPVIEPVFPVTKKEPMDPNRTLHHWKHYQTYVTRGAKDVPQERKLQSLEYNHKPQPFGSNSSQPTGFSSKVYPPIYSKPHGDHWNHYTAWLLKKGIQKLLYKSPTSRPESFPKAPPDISKLSREQSTTNVSKNVDQPVSKGEQVDTDFTKDTTVDNKIEYLHQRWLAWQQNLASKMVNKLNKMLKYYENPEGNIDIDTVKVRDMIKQRDYWREIHRWTSRKGFTLYNKTPPQSRPSGLNLARLQTDSKPQWLENSTKHNSYSSNNTAKPIRPWRTKRFQEWGSPDPDLFVAPPKTSILKTETTESETPINETEKLPNEAEKPPTETKRPKFPFKSEPIEDLDDQEVKYSTHKGFYRNTAERMSKILSSNENTLKEYKDNLRNPQSIQNKNYKPRQKTSEDEGMPIDDQQQDKFLKEISDLLGQNVVLEGRSGKSKSRSEKRLERKLKAKYQVEKKERKNAKKGYDFVFKKKKIDLSDDEMKEFSIVPATEEDTSASSESE